MKKIKIILLWVLGFSSWVNGHTLPVSYLTLVPDANYVHLELLLNPFDLSFFPEIDANHNGALESTELDQHRTAVQQRILECIELRSNRKIILPEISGAILSLTDHHLILRAHYRGDARWSKVFIDSRLPEITRGGHWTQVSFGDQGHRRSVILDGQSHTATFKSADRKSPFSYLTWRLLSPSNSSGTVLWVIFAIGVMVLIVGRGKAFVLQRSVFLGAMCTILIILLVIVFRDSQRSESKLFGSAEPAGMVWSIGKSDGSSIEFAPGSRESLTFTVGKSVPEKDFPAHQAGSIGFEPNAPSIEKPYTIAFDLDGNLQDAYQFVADFIFLSGAPRRMKVLINGRKGVFLIEPHSSAAVDSNDASSILLARQRLIVPIKPGWLNPKSNQITLIPIGIGSLDYDALMLQKDNSGNSEKAKGGRLEPTVFYREKSGKLFEVCMLRIPFDKPFKKGTATVQVGGVRLQQKLTPPDADFGVLVEELEVPALSQQAKAEIKIELDDKSQQSSHAFTPAKQWKVYICPKVHNDVGYTDVQPHVNELDTRNTDTVLDILEKFPFFKFNFETAWLVDNYLDTRPPQYRKLFLNWAAKGRAAINAFYLNLMTGICSGEELHRAMYFTQALHREHGSNFDFACLTDAPSHSWFLPTLLSDVGIQAFSNGSNQTRAPILQLSSLNEDSPFYWEGMNGERIMMWYARSYSQWKRLTGPGYLEAVASYDYLKTSVPQFLLRYLRENYPLDAVMVYGAYVDNAAIPRTAEAPLIEQWNREFQYPKLVVASDADYFQYIQQHYSDRLKVYRGDAGAYWEDGAASTAKATSLNRHSQQVLPLAETLAGFATLFEPRFRYPAEDFRAAWKNVMFYDEHTWGAYSSILQPDREFVTRQWEIKESYATRADLDARNLLARALNRLCQQMAVQGDTIFAFNLHNEKRSAPVEVELDKTRYVVDLATQQQIPLDIVFEKDGWRKVRFMAVDVPAFGYKGYALRSLDKTAPTKAENLKLTGDTIESPYYRLTVDNHTGSIKSLYDKAAQREMVDSAAAYGLNQYLYVSGGQDTRLIDNVYGRTIANLAIDSPTSANVLDITKTPFGQRLVVETSAKNTPRLRTEYIVYDTIKRVDIHNVVTRTETREKEAIYFAFPFSAGKPFFEYQIQNGWVRPNEDQLPGACREWFTTQNLVHVRDGDYSIAWSTPDAPLITLTDINRGKWLKQLEINNGHVFSYVMNNYWFTNYKAAQGGDFQFRYSLTSGSSLGREQLARFDADTRTPVIAYPLLSTFSASVENTGRPLSATSGSFMRQELTNLQLVVMKAAEDGDGYIFRFRETAGKSGQAEVSLPTTHVNGAYLCNGVEANKEALPSTANTVRFPYKPNAYVTLRLKAEGAQKK